MGTKSALTHFVGGNNNSNYSSLSPNRECTPIGVIEKKNDTQDGRSVKKGAWPPTGIPSCRSGCYAFSLFFQEKCMSEISWCDFVGRDGGKKRHVTTFARPGSSEKKGPAELQRGVATPRGKSRAQCVTARRAPDCVIVSLSVVTQNSTFHQTHHKTPEQLDTTHAQQCTLKITPAQNTSPKTHQSIAKPQQRNTAVPQTKHRKQNVTQNITKKTRGAITFSTKAYIFSTSLFSNSSIARL